MTKLAKFDLVTLKKQRNYRAIIARMTLTIIETIRNNHDKRNPGAIFEEFLVWCVILANDADGGKPLTIAAIAKRLLIPRSNVNRSVGRLVEAGIARKEGRAYSQDIQFFAARVDGPCFTQARAAIFKAADELRASLADAT